MGERERDAEGRTSVHRKLGKGRGWLQTPQWASSTPVAPARQICHGPVVPGSIQAPAEEEASEPCLVPPQLPAMWWVPLGRPPALPC